MTLVWFVLIGMRLCIWLLFVFDCRDLEVRWESKVKVKAGVVEEEVEGEEEEEEVEEEAMMEGVSKWDGKKTKDRSVDHVSIFVLLIY